VTDPPPERQPISRIAELIICPLAASVVFAVGAFVSAFAAFVLLPVVSGHCVWRFLRDPSRRRLPLKWHTVLTGNILVLAFLISTVFLGCEAYYRFFCDQTDAMTNTLVSGAWYARHFHENNFGLRDNVDYSHALTAGRRRVTFVGDSCTAGFGVKDVEDRFVNRIRRLHPEWEVHAIAKPGLDTSTEVEIMHNLTVSNRYQLDYVVLVYNLNDIGEVMPGWVEGYKQMLADPFRQSWVCRNSYFVNLFYHRWQLRRNAYMKKYFDEVETAYKGPLWEIEKAGLTAFANMTRIRGGRLLVVTFPFLQEPLRFKFAHERLNRFWDQQSIPHMDLLDTFGNVPTAKLVVNSNDAHPNEQAHALAAEAIDEFLKHQIGERRGEARKAR
jgi:lysophospholipase L1-like esterase